MNFQFQKPIEILWSTEKIYHNVQLQACQSSQIRKGYLYLTIPFVFFIEDKNKHPSFCFFLPNFSISLKDIHNFSSIELQEIEIPSIVHHILFTTKESSYDILNIIFLELPNYNLFF
jgi:hypothetical protein